MADMDPGGNKSDLAARTDADFRARGWREVRHDTEIITTVRRMPYKAAGEKMVESVVTPTASQGTYKVDNFKGRVALDVEWNAKDGNLDRDLGAYRALYDSGLIDAGVIILRTQDDLRALAVELGFETKFGTTTTTNLSKLVPRMTRGSSGGCPVLAVAISARCFVQR